MKVAVCEDTDWLLSEEAYSIYAPCMYHPTCEDYRTQMEGFLQASSVKVLVCEDRNRKAGMMVLKFSEAAAEIIGIAVSEKLRRRGIGKQLILSAMELERIGRIEAQTDDDSTGILYSLNTMHRPERAIEGWNHTILFSSGQAGMYGAGV